MALVPDPPFPKSRGQTIRSKDWNDIVNEVIRLDGAKVNKAGDNMTGPLNVSGNVGIGTTTTQRLLHVEGSEIHSGGALAGFSFSNRQATDFVEVPAGGERWVWYSDQAMARLWSGGDKLLVSTGGNLQVTGSLLLPNTGGGTASFLHGTFDNENTFHPNNLKLSMGSTGFIIVGHPFQYEFAIGHITSFFGIPPNPGSTNFVKNFSVTEDGTVFVSGTASVQNLAIRSGAKPGYVIDHFVNRSGETLEQGDVVVIAEATSRYWATGNDVPILEVEAADQAYDTRVCGIVARVVTDRDLPYVDLAAQPAPKTRGRKKNEEAQADTHPLARLAATAAEELDTTKVVSHQLGSVVTMGAFAYCKVDADIAPIKVGDLLTTSPTKGHAQKAVESGKAVGAIVGKALGALRKGQDKIPVLVMMQ